MVDKIITHFEFFLPVTFELYISKINRGILYKTWDQQMDFCFSLFDDNSDGFICINDLNAMSVQFAGYNYYIMSDVLELIKYLHKKDGKIQLFQELQSPSKIKKRKQQFRLSREHVDSSMKDSRLGS